MQTSTNTYQGWTNRATWAVALWLSNDHNLYIAVQQLKEQFPDINDFIDKLQELVEEANPLADSADVYSDLLRFAFDSVDWRQIAERELEG